MTRPQFSLKTLLWLTVVVAITMSAFSWGGEPNAYSYSKNTMPSQGNVRNTRL